MTIAVITPADFDPTDSDVKRPLLCVIHGGPTGTDMPSLPDRNYYPIEHWVGSVSRTIIAGIWVAFLVFQERQQSSWGQALPEPSRMAARASAHHRQAEDWSDPSRARP